MDYINLKRNLLYNNNYPNCKTPHHNNNNSVNQSQQSQFNATEKLNFALFNFGDRFDEFSSDCNEKKNQINNNNLINTNNSRFNLISQKLSLSVPRYQVIYHNSRSTTPMTRNSPTKKDNFLIKKNHDKKNVGKRNDYNAQKYNTVSNTIDKNSSHQNFTKFSIRKNNANIRKKLDKIKNLKFDEEIKDKDLNNTNNFLKKENMELRKEIKKKSNIINDLLEELNLLKMDEHKLSKKKTLFFSKINNAENELKIKDSLISKLNEKIIELNLKMYEKDIEIKKLANKNNSEEILNTKIKQLLKQIDNLKKENLFLKNEKLMENKNNKAINLKNNSNNNALIQENRKLKKLYNYMKNENEKIKASFEKQKNDNQNNINDLTQKLIIFEEENNYLKTELNNPNSITSFNNILKKNEPKSNRDEKSQLINQLKEENKKLKTQLDKYNNSSNNNQEELSFLKNDIEEKTSEIKDLEEKIKNLMNNLIISKDEISDYKKQNLELKNKLDQANTIITNLEQNNLINEQKIRELNNQNNKLKIKMNSVRSDSDDFQNTHELIKKLQKQNEDLQEKISHLNYNQNNKTNEINLEKEALVKENNDLKNERANLQNHIKELENQNKNNILQVCKMSELYPNSCPLYNGEELSKTLLEKDMIIEKLKKEIKKKKKIIYNLKEEFKNKGLQIQKLTGEKNSSKNYIFIEEDNFENDLDKINKYYTINNSSGKDKKRSFTKSSRNGPAKIKTYLNQIKELTEVNDSDQIQIKALKEDIKELNAKIKNLQTFSGQLKDFNEFVGLINLVMDNYKPKKKNKKMHKINLYK